MSAIFKLSDHRKQALKWMCALLLQFRIHSSEYSTKKKVTAVQIKSLNQKKKDAKSAIIIILNRKV